MLFSAAWMTDDFWKVVYGALALLLAWLSKRTRDSIVATAGAAAVQAKEVKQELAKNNEEVKQELANNTKTTEATHLLVNSANLTHLRLYAIATGRLAVLPYATKEDIDIAEEAERVYQLQLAKQKVVDDVK